MRWPGPSLDCRLQRKRAPRVVPARSLPIRLAIGLAVFTIGLPAQALSVRLDRFSCDSGPYAVVLPRHYPSLHVIGRHQFSDRSVRPDGAGTVTVRRIDYIGLSLEVQVRSAEPDRYVLLGLDVNSRRWNVGPLSVGRSPWRSIDEPALDGRLADGPLELVGKKDSVQLELRAGRVETARYRCPLANP